MSYKKYAVSMLCATSLFIASITQASSPDSLSTFKGMVATIASSVNSQVSGVVKKLSAEVSNSLAIETLTWMAEYNKKLVMDSIDYSNEVVLKIVRNEPVTIEQIQNDPKFKALVEGAAAPAKYAIGLTIFFGGWGVVVPVLVTTLLISRALESDIANGSTKKAEELIKFFSDMTKQQVEAGLAAAQH